MLINRLKCKVTIKGVEQHPAARDSKGTYYAQKKCTEHHFFIPETSKIGTSPDWHPGSTINFGWHRHCNCVGCRSGRKWWRWSQAFCKQDTHTHRDSNCHTNDSNFNVNQHADCHQHPNHHPHCYCVSALRICRAGG